jgi:putative membrane protein
MVPFGNFGWNFGVGFGWLIVVVTLILIVFGVVQLVRFMSRDREAEEQDICETSPLDMLNRRYARGEITKNEFDQKRADIESEQKKAA